jgi:hypothetical protein
MQIETRSTRHGINSVRYRRCSGPQRSNRHGEACSSKGLRFCRISSESVPTANSRWVSEGRIHTSDVSLALVKHRHSGTVRPQAGANLMDGPSIRGDSLWYALGPKERRSQINKLSHGPSPIDRARWI